MNRTSILPLVLNHGREIFGKEFPKERTERVRWLSDKARQGCPLSRQLLEKPSSKVHVLAGDAHAHAAVQGSAAPMPETFCGAGS